VRCAVFFASVTLLLACAEKPPMGAMHGTTVTVAPGHHLRDDGRGPYSQGVDNVNVFYESAAWHRWVFRPTFEGSDKPIRSLVLNLDDADSSSQAVPLGEMRDFRPQLVLFRRSDDFDKMLVGSSETVPKAVIQFGSANKRYALVFQTDTMNRGNTRIAGDGTNGVTLRRLADSTWEADLPSGSFGRLWEDPQEQKPIDRGRYHFDFQLRIAPTRQ
jgi:hypothetical protein